MPGGRFRPGPGGKKGAAPPEGGGKPGEATPPKPTETPPAKPGEHPGAPEATAAKPAEHGTPIEPTAQKGAREAMPESRASERSTHHDAPEIEPGTNVVARESSVGDHTVSVTKDGKVVVCSTCGEIAKVFEPEIVEFGLQHELIAIEGMASPKAKAAAAARLHAKLVGLRNIANQASGRPLGAGDPGGALARVRNIAAEMRIPENAVAQHLQELISTGRHPEGIPPEGPYGQRLLRLAESLVGPRISLERTATPEFSTKPPPKLLKRYKLTSEQNKTFKERLEGAKGRPNQEEQVRFERKQRELINQDKEPYRDISEYRDAVASKQIVKARESTKHADSVRDAVAEHFGTKLASGDKAPIYEIEIPNAPPEGPKTARPDSYSVDAKGQPALEQGIVHDHKHMFGKSREQILTDTAQLQAERAHAHANGAEHVISMSSETPNLGGKPPTPRPHSDIIDAGSKVVYADPTTKQVTHKWEDGAWVKL